MAVTGNGVPELFASKIEYCEDNGDHTYRLWCVVDRALPGQEHIAEPVVSIVMPENGVAFSISVLMAALAHGARTRIANLATVLAKRAAELVTLAEGNNGNNGVH